ncbi:MAG: nucleotidyl transferase AbiEii/AbiGii toxin family protein [Clostridiales Family XIII bacterium]|jgi:hypothetical protein|nr:nucleotidyl transferase AbiEii/AbiGii toxin family protein [Clostridiales Family XIII bacterium]
MNETYLTPHAVEQSIKDAAKMQFQNGSKTSISDLIQQEYRNRFLSRVFSSGSANWVLKGGTGILARIPDARMTIDIDLLSKFGNIDRSLSDLTKCAEIDLYDFFQFNYAGHIEIGRGENQPNTVGYRVSFDIYIGQSQKGKMHIDLVEGGIITDEIVENFPIEQLDLPKLKSYPYRLYPIVDQIADKICAICETHNASASSRVKDLIDIVEFITRFDISGNKLMVAVKSEALNRFLPLPLELPIPESWRVRYEKIAKSTPAVQGYTEFNEAITLVDKFINPILSATNINALWRNKSLCWGD